jgi:hypothetical protein
MNTHGLVIILGLVWVFAMLRLLPRAWRLDHVRPDGGLRRKPRELPSIKLNPMVFQPLFGLWL